jgi:HNH endonuclease/AP2 domain
MRKIKKPAGKILDYIDLHYTLDDKGRILKDGVVKGGKRKKDGHIILHDTTGKIDNDNAVTFNTYAHQVVWYLTYGAWPTTYIDHIDGDGSNNAPSNLRSTTSAQNSHNQRKVSKKTTSKYKGVYCRKDTKARPWRAKIDIGGKQIQIGHFATEDEAAKAYDAKAIELFGEFACLNFGANNAVERKDTVLLEKLCSQENYFDLHFG